MITAERVRSAIHYDPDRGVFTRLDGPFAGKTAGSPNSLGYIHIQIDGTLYKAHRLAWLYVTGKWPEASIDHINTIKNDNRFVNLRSATHSQNCANKRPTANNTSGSKGVHWKTRNGKWCAQIAVKGKKKHLGLFSDKAEAEKCYAEAATKCFGEFWRAQ